MVNSGHVVMSYKANVEPHAGEIRLHLGLSYLFLVGDWNTESQGDHPFGVHTRGFPAPGLMRSMRTPDLGPRSPAPAPRTLYFTS